MGGPGGPVKKIIFFLGKGGVGKTSSSAALAWYLAGKRERVYWLSIDPAHNLCDIVGCDSFKGTKEIDKGLIAEEIDTDRYTEAYLKSNIGRMKDTYRYLEIINLERAFDILKYSPGIEEAAIMYALTESIKKHMDTVDYIIVDTPPTGLMLKILALPFTSTLWIERLRSWREKILDKRKTVNAIKREDSPYIDLAIEKENDPVFQELGKQMETMQFLTSLLIDRSRTVMALVLNQDRLSLAESGRISDGLASFHIGLDLVLLNKFGMVDETEDHIRERFGDTDIVKLPYISDHVLSRESLVDLATHWADKVM
jgi:arsenite-transporting ATPase